VSEAVDTVAGRVAVAGAVAIVAVGVEPRL
jgi:hypothetical protein